MANYQLFNDKIASVPIVFKDGLGNPITQPEGDGFSVANVSPNSVTASMSFTGANNVGPHLNLVPKVQTSPGLVVTVTDTLGHVVSIPFDIVGDPNAVVMVADMANITTTSQAVPSAPGP